MMARSKLYFLFIAFVFASLASANGGEESSQKLRHLIQGWPGSRSNEVKNKDNKLKSFESILLKSKLIDIENRLSNLWGELKKESRPECGQSAAFALEALIQKWRAQAPNVFECQESCHEALDSAIYIGSKIDSLELALAPCMSLADQHPWYFEVESGLNVNAEIRSVYDRNPLSSSLASQGESSIASDISGTIEGVVKSASTWHRASFLPEYWIDPKRKNVFLWDHRQKHVVSFSPDTALSIDAKYSKDLEWIPSGSVAQRAEVKILEGKANVGWKVFSRRFELEGLYSRETWLPTLWGQTRIGGNNRIYFQDTTSSSAFLEISYSRYSFLEDILSETLWNWGAAYNLIVKQAREGEINVLLGFMDNRFSVTGAQLWPRFHLVLKTPSIAFPNLMAIYKFHIEPEVLPWSIMTLEIAGSFGLTIKWEKFEFPALMGLKKQMHRGLPGTRRDDRILWMELGSQYQIEDQMVAKISFEGERRWIPATVASDIPFPKESFQNYRVAGSLRYEF